MRPSSSDAEPTMRGFSPGARVFGRYTLAAMLGRGGMGVVWRARDDVLGEDVALKFLPDAVRWDPGAYDDLKAETRRARQLTHPNIVRIHDFVEDAGSVAISMELVPGSTLTALRLAKPGKVFEPADILPWLPQLCAALDYAHQEARVIHRDLKPTNVMLTPDGRVKVADFGVARSMTDSISRVSMMAAGTLVYMSPQQAMGEEPSPADDIYALGATLYELLTGRPPFHTGDVRTQLFQRVPESLTARRKALGVSGAAIPAAWERTLAACLAKSAEERPATAKDVAARLGAPGVGRAEEAVAAAAPPRIRVVTGPRLLLGALAAAIGLGGWQLWRRTERAVVRTEHASDATRALAAWNFDGDARDASGRGLDGAVGRAVPTADRFGRIDRALHFNGNAEVVIADAPVLRWGGEQPFTAAIWVRRMEDGNSHPMCWRFAGEGVNTLTWFVGFSGDRATAHVGRIHADEETMNTSLIAPSASTAGTWCHLALVSDGAATVTLYVNGVPAVAAPLGRARAATAPKQVALRFGRPDRLAPGSFAGDLDEARLWLRPLAAEEIAELARGESPPRFALSKALAFDTDDFAAAITNEFGPAARLADWAEIKRFHADDTRAWADEHGLAVGATSGWIQREGRRSHDGQRSYFLNRFDGTKPAYYEAHDELGGMGVALGSWYGIRAPLLVRLPASPPRRHRLTADADGLARTTGVFDPSHRIFSLVWKGMAVRPATAGVKVELRLRDERRIGALCREIETGVLAVGFSDPARSVQSRQVADASVELEFTLVGREGELRFRAVTAVGRNPLFEERLVLPEFKVGDLMDVEVLGLTPAANGLDRGAAGVELTVE